MNVALHRIIELMECDTLKDLSDKVRMYDEEIMTNDDNLESNLLTSSLLKMSGLHAGTS